LGGIFLEEFFGRNFLGGFIFGRIFLGGFFWEDFFGRIFWEDYLEDFLGGILWEEFFVYIGIDLFVKILVFVKILSQWRRKENLHP
jgi:hypothetical protein